jgi:hypothetical protein
MILRHARTFALVVLVTLAGPVAEAAAQDLHPSRRPSPVGIAKTFVGDTYVKITYGRPYARGRAIFGDPADGNTYLVPFGQTWRTGAYALFTVPGASTWEIRLNPELGMDGTGRLGPDGSFTNAYDPAADLLVIEAQPGTLAQAVDQFTIVFEPVGNGVHMVLSWENTEVRVPIEAAER